MDVKAGSVQEVYLLLKQRWIDLPESEVVEFFNALGYAQFLLVTRTEVKGWHGVLVHPDPIVVNAWFLEAWVNRSGISLSYSFGLTVFRAWNPKEKKYQNGDHFQLFSWIGATNVPIHEVIYCRHLPLEMEFDPSSDVRETREGWGWD